jgi:hypothetical protein
MDAVGLQGIRGRDQRQTHKLREQKKKPGTRKEKETRNRKRKSSQEQKT